jgi:hypothetical protein
MTLLQFITRALYDRNQSLAGVRVRLVGFVGPGEGGGGGDEGGYPRPPSRRPGGDPKALSL